MDSLSSSICISNFPELKQRLDFTLSSSPVSSYCFCNLPGNRVGSLKLRYGYDAFSSLRVKAVRKDAPSEGEDDSSTSNEFGFAYDDLVSFPKVDVKNSLSGEEDEHKLVDAKSSPTATRVAGTGVVFRPGLYRTPISGGVQSATSSHGLPRPALAVRNLMEQARFGHVCTIMSRMHHRRQGYPFGSLVDFAPDPMGHPIFLFSPLAIHTRNILANPRCSLVVQIPGWSGLSNARVTILGDVYPLKEDHLDWAREQFFAKHHLGLSQKWGNLHFYRMHHISDIYFIGGFGTIAWVDVEEYQKLQPDKIVVDGEQNLKELNLTFSTAIRELLSKVTVVDDAAIISVDSKGIDIRVREGAQFNMQRLTFQEGHPIETLEAAKAALWKVLKKV